MVEEGEADIQKTEEDRPEADLRREIREANSLYDLSRWRRLVKGDIHILGSLKPEGGSLFFAMGGSGEEEVENVQDFPLVRIGSVNDKTVTIEIYCSVQAGFSNEEPVDKFQIGLSEVGTKKKKPRMTTVLIKAGSVSESSLSKKDSLGQLQQIILASEGVENGQNPYTHISNFQCQLDLFPVIGGISVSVEDRNSGIWVLKNPSKLSQESA